MTPARALLLAAALAAAAPLPARAHQDRVPLPASPAGRLGPAEREVLEALARWDTAAARAAAGRIADPEGATGRLLRGQLALHEGEYGEAARLFASLPAPLSGAPGVAEARRVAEASLAMRRRLEPRASEHFVLWHDPQADAVLAEPALEALERARAAAGALLGDLPPGKVRVEIVPAAADFERVSGLGRAEIEAAGAVGTCARNGILVLSPRLLLRGYRWRDTLGHEYLHYAQVRLAGNRAPIWLQEGVARYGEALWRRADPEPLADGDRALLARALREGALPGFGAMEPSLARLPTPGAVRLALAQAYLAVERIAGARGGEGLRRVYAELARPGEPPDLDAALRAAVGESQAQLEAGVRAAVAAGGFRESPGLLVPPFRLAGEGSAEEWDLAEWQGEGARNHLRLGDLLRGRGSLRAALIEYGRAGALAPASPLPHLKAARVELELGRPERSAAAAGEAVRLWRDLPAAQLALARALAALGRHGEAAAALAEALEVNPFDPYAWRDLAAELRAAGMDGEEARRAQRTALQLARDDEERLRMMTTDGPGDRGRRE